MTQLGSATLSVLVSSLLVPDPLAKTPCQLGAWAYDVSLSPC